MPYACFGDIHLPSPRMRSLSKMLPDSPNSTPDWFPLCLHAAAVMLKPTASIGVPSFKNSIAINSRSKVPTDRFGEDMIVLKDAHA